MRAPAEASSGANRLAGGDSLAERERQQQLALVHACIAGDQAAQARFCVEFDDCLYVGVRRICAEAGFVEETVQRLRGRLLTGSDAKLAAYSGSGPLRAWLQVVASRAAIDALRSETRRRRYERAAADEVAFSVREIDTCCEATRYGKLFASALHSALGSLDAKERELLRLRYVAGHELVTIGDLQGLHRATISRWLSMLCTRLRFALRAGLSRRGAELSPSDMHGLGQSLQSQLAGTVASWLGDSRAAHEPTPAPGGGGQRA
jgi:RNA polymerase sigma-70 factor, ECF subfamily